MIRNTNAIQSKKKFSFMRREYATVIIILLILLLSAIYKPALFVGDRLGEMVTSILLWMPLIVTVSMGMLMVIITKCIDISVGSIIGLTGMMIGLLFRDYHISLLLATLISMLIGLGAGIFNGILVSYLKIPSLIVTLATLNLYRGLAMVSGNYEIPTAILPADMFVFVKESFLGIPYLTWIALIVVGIMVFVMSYSHFGREVYAVGSNEEAARLRGINVKKVKLIVFMLTGLFAGLAGIMYGARYGNYHAASTGLGFEFVVISATVIGGASLNGGSGTIIGTLLGSILLGTIQTMIPMMGLSGYYYKACYGFIIMIALIIDKVIGSRQLIGAIKGGFSVK